MQTENWIAELNEIEKRIYSTIKSTDERLFPIADGIIDIKKYKETPIKILWILKEPYDHFDSSKKSIGGGWHIRDAINSKTNFNQFIGGKKTFSKMIYVNYGIQNNFLLRKQMPTIQQTPEMLEALKSSAYINIKKIPGQKSSTPKVIQQSYNSDKGIILHQIETIKPSIIICGGTFNLLINDLEIRQLIKHNSVSYAITNKFIIIKAYHPSYRTSTTKVSEDQYCNDIITVSKNYYSLSK